ncbi:glycosyltransferase [Rhodopseudomonas palustris]|uniref:glycosyltransferase n=1 Tax=Rhodopseudomonas palustris TaxID=1076 RepID=UPI002ACEC829|nr:glycosyltransferase [Rhodopseudomonas palustris]WQG97492.1 glycosyltransferase [Rhodopseudomonas palustris]
MLVVQLSEELSRPDDQYPNCSLGFGLPKSLLLKWQSAGPDFHKRVPMLSATDADVLLAWWLSSIEAGSTEADALTAAYLLDRGPYCTDQDIADKDRLPYDWLVQIFVCEREFTAERFRVALPESLALSRRRPEHFQYWIANIERILETHPALGPGLFDRIAADAMSIDPDWPQDGVLPPLRLFGWIRDARAELQAAFDLGNDEGYTNFIGWFFRSGLLEYRLALRIFLQWLQPARTESGAPYCGEAALPAVVAQAAVALGPELALLGADGPPADDALFGWWLRAARHLRPRKGQIGARLQLVRMIRAFWFEANFGALAAPSPVDIPRYLTRLHQTEPKLRDAYDLATPEGRADFLAWWERAGRFAHSDFAILEREFLFAPTLAFEQDLDIPISNGLLQLRGQQPALAYDLASSAGRLNFSDSLKHLSSSGQLHALKQQICTHLGAANQFTDDLCGIARQLVSAEVLPLPSSGHAAWWRNEQRHYLYRVGYGSHGLRMHPGIPIKAAVAGRQRVDVEIAGFPRAESGQGEDARTVFESLQQETSLKLSLFHTRRWLPGPNKAAEKVERFIQPDLQDARIRIFAFSGFDMLAEQQFEGLAGFAADYVIGYWPWELSRWPRRVSLPHLVVDEIWSSTRFIVDSLSPATSKPVIHMPLPVTVDMSALPGRDAIPELPRDRFNFVFVFDGFSYFARKNPLGTIRAFQRAFPKGQFDDVGLTIKAMNAEGNPVLLALKMFAEEDPRINLIYETWDRARVMQLIESADALVSLHRSEGFGRIMAEAMLLRTPVIASNYSGNRDFCTDETAFVVDGHVTPVLEDQYIYWNDQEWFEPSTESAAAHMKALFTDPNIATAKVERARRNMLDNYSLQACGRRYAERIDTILSRT